MLVADLKSIVSDDLNGVDKLILSSLYSEVPLIQEIGHYIIRGGGKRLRPLLVLLCAKACGYSGAKHIAMATVVEFIHTATLLHDDVVDESAQRRGYPTANSKWGNEAAVLVGDFLYSRAFQLMVDVGDLEILQIFANATNTIAEGEVLQLLNQQNPQTNEQNYLHVIRCKTAKLFEAAAEVGAVLTGSSAHMRTIMAQYGLHIGTAYQLIDDLLDYQATDAAFGKKLGQDLTEGKPTLPLIYLLQHGTEQQRALASDAISDPQAIKLAAVQEAIQNSGALEYTLAFAKREAILAKQALSELIDSEYRSAALDLADFVVQRTF